jgi:selenide,water dikinase
VKLTALAHGAGCACKFPPGELHALVAELRRPANAEVVVGTETADDAAVYRLSADLALVSSVDFFTPIVDDPYDFGRIAAANALSDIYAMGGKPILALNLVAYSLDELGGEILRQILRGAADITDQAGVAILGGHSIDDREPKFGLSVTGTVHPDRVMRNSTARDGDHLFLTKPVGGGIATTAAKRGQAPGSLIAETTRVMTALNANAATAAIAAGASAMTDVTGYGLVGHLHELALASGLAAELDGDAVPALPDVLNLLGRREPPIPGGTRRNRTWVEPHVNWAPSVAEERRWLLCDAMTSGGLLIASKPRSRSPGVCVGRLREGAAGSISVR